MRLSHRRKIAHKKGSYHPRWVWRKPCLLKYISVGNAASFITLRRGMSAHALLDETNRFGCCSLLPGESMAIIDRRVIKHLGDRQVAADIVNLIISDIKKARSEHMEANIQPQSRFSKMIDGLKQKATALFGRHRSVFNRA